MPAAHTRSYGKEWIPSFQPWMKSRVQQLEKACKSDRRDLISKSTHCFWLYRRRRVPSRHAGSDWFKFGIAD